MIWTTGRPPGRDALLAAGLAVVTLTGSYASSRHGWGQHATPLGTAGYLLALTSCGALAWRRLYPTVVLLIVFGSVLAYNQIGYPAGPIYLPLIVAFCTAILRGDRRVSYAVLAVGYLISTCAGPVLHGNRLPTAAQFGGLAAWLLVFAAAAELFRIRARARRAETEEAIAAEQARAEHARRQAGEERLRIAQDLHDILAHQLALITVQANVGLAMIEREPSKAAGSLTAIKDAGNRALSELRTVLDALRTTAGPDGGRSADLASPPEGGRPPADPGSPDGSEAAGPVSSAGAVSPAGTVSSAGRARRPAGQGSAGGGPGVIGTGAGSARVSASLADPAARHGRPAPAADGNGGQAQPGLPSWPGALRPAPLISRSSDLATVIGGTRAAGLTVRQETAGAQPPLPAPLDQGAYRIVQEALTNAVRHGGPGTRVRLRIEYGPADLRILVEDDGGGAPGAGTDAGSGNGLAGMRERAAALHGTLQAGPRPAGGFLVSARLPLGLAR
ncbi:MAG TPA: histidine kinase [Streptosporangiaceae bacterium]